MKDAYSCNECIFVLKKPYISAIVLKGIAIHCLKTIKVQKHEMKPFSPNKVQEPRIALYLKINVIQIYPPITSSRK